MLPVVDFWPMTPSAASQCKECFFSGESRDISLYTAHPTMEADMHWLSQPSTRSGHVMWEPGGDGS